MVSTDSSGFDSCIGGCKVLSIYSTCALNTSTSVIPMVSTNPALFDFVRVHSAGNKRRRTFSFGRI